MPKGHLENKTISLFFIISNDENDVDLIAFNYNNDIVTLVQKDTTSFSEDDKSTYEFTKCIIVVMMIEWVAELYNVNLDDLDENQLTKYGINITTIKNTDDDGNEQDIITNFSIDLNQFESSTKSLQGSTNTDDETTSFSTVEPSVSLQLGKSNSDSIDLIVKVKDLSENSTAKCEIYMIPDSGTAFETGQSKLVGKINNCKNGNNSYTVSNLKSNSKYTFQVVLEEDLSLGLTKQVVGDKYVTFSTTSLNEKTTPITTTGSNEIATNPKTGVISAYITMIAAAISFISLILLYLKGRKEKILEI